MYLNLETLWLAIAKSYVGDPALQALCLRVQDEHDADVVFLLLMAVLDGEGLGLGEDDLRNLEATARDWWGFAVVPLRALRRRKVEADGPLARWEPIRQQLKGLELEAEKQELALMVPALQAAKADAPGGLVARYLAMREVVPDLTQALIAKLA